MYVCVLNVMPDDERFLKLLLSVTTLIRSWSLQVSREMMSAPDERKSAMFMTLLRGSSGYCMVLTELALPNQSISPPMRNFQPGAADQTHTQMRINVALPFIGAILEV